jgi:small ligand-binding sensory domain FIST
MRFHASVSENETSADAARELFAAARASRVSADVAFLFFTAHHNEDIESVTEKAWLELDPQVMLGCSAEGVIGGDREVERSPGMSLLVGELPGVRLHPFHIRTEEWREMITDDEALKERIAHGPETRAVIGFGDPFTVPLNQLLPALDKIAPSAPLVGGMASSARQPGENRLIRNDQVLEDGFVGVSLAGPIDVQTVVSQGCRPIGKTLLITKGHDNVIEQLGGKPALTALRETVNELSEQDKHLLGNGLLIGLAISEYRERFGRGDFLVRNLVGVDQNSGAIALADYVRVGQTVQFHVRDAATADEDLGLLLEPQRVREAPAGGLLFSCNGRGTHLFDTTCHDISAARSAMPSPPASWGPSAAETSSTGIPPASRCFGRRRISHRWTQMNIDETE